MANPGAWLTNAKRARFIGTDESGSLCLINAFQAELNKFTCAFHGFCPEAQP
jgi:hypothetical protein